jgi:hypothetical protein
MGDYDLMGLLRQGVATAQSGLQAWGVSQEARRASEYQRAVTQSREGFSRLYQEIQRTPEYQTYETLFAEGATQIRDDVLSGITDEMVRQQFTNQFMTMEETARAEVQGYAFSREKMAIATEGFNNVTETHQTHQSFMAAELEAASIIDNLYQTGMINEQQQEAYWTEWRRLGALEFDVRMENAIENQSRESVENLVREAFATEIIVSDEMAAEVRSNALHAIGVAEFRDVSFAIATAGTQTPGVSIEEAYDTAMAWVVDNYEDMGLTYDESNEIWLELNRKVDWAYARERREIERTDYQAAELASRVESQILTGDENAEIKDWTSALAWLEEDDQLNNMLQSTTDYYRARWTGLMLEELDQAVGGDEPREFASTGDIQTTRQMIYGWITSELYTQAEIEEMITAALLPDENGLRYLKTADATALRELNQNREQETSEVETMIDAAMSRFAGDLTPDTQELLEYQIRRALPTMMFEPGTIQRRDEETVMNEVRELVMHYTQPGRMENVPEAMTNLEGIFGPSGRNILDPSERATIDVQNRLFTGIADPRATLQALGSGITDEDAIRALIMPDIDRDVFTEEELQVFDNQVELIKLANGHMQAYERQFGRRPRITSNPETTEVIVLVDGGVAFRHPDGHLIRLQVDSDRIKDEEWYYLASSGGWSRSDRLNVNPDTGDDAGSGTGSRLQTVREGVREANEQVERAKVQVRENVHAQIRDIIDNDNERWMAMPESHRLYLQAILDNDQWEYPSTRGGAMGLQILVTYGIMPLSRPEPRESETPDYEEDAGYTDWTNYGTGGE